MPKSCIFKFFITIHNNMFYIKFHYTSIHTHTETSTVKVEEFGENLHTLWDTKYSIPFYSILLFQRLVTSAWFPDQWFEKCSLKYVFSHIRKKTWVLFFLHLWKHYEDILIPSVPASPSIICQNFLLNTNIYGPEHIF